MGVGRYGKNKMLLDLEDVGIASVLDVQPLFFLLKKIGFVPSPDIKSVDSGL